MGSEDARLGNEEQEKLNGERGRNRTFNLLIKSQLLCQLSYAPFKDLQGIPPEEVAEIVAGAPEGSLGESVNVETVSVSVSNPNSILA